MSDDMQRLWDNAYAVGYWAAVRGEPLKETPPIRSRTKEIEDQGYLWGWNRGSLARHNAEHPEEALL